MPAAAPLYEALPPVVSFGPDAASPADGAADEEERELDEVERLVAAGEHEAAVARLEALRSAVRDAPRLALRHRLAESRAEMARGRLERAAELLEQADGLVSSPRFDAVERADVLFRRSCVSLARGHASEAASLLTRALETNERSARPSQLLAARAYERRSRCHGFLGDWDTARRDAERSLDLATELGDEQAQANALLQASLVAERQRHWLLARFYAEEALERHRRHGDGLASAQILANLGRIDALLGNLAEAERNLMAAMRTAAEAGSDAGVAQATAALARLYLRTGRTDDARTQALVAVEALAGRTDRLGELGSAQLVLARAYAADGDRAAAEEWLDRAELSLSRHGRGDRLPAAWIVRGDLYRDAGDADTAADLYRRAATSLHDPDV